MPHNEQSPSSLIVKLAGRKYSFEKIKTMYGSYFAHRIKTSYSERFEFFSKNSAESYYRSLNIILRGIYLCAAAGCSGSRGVMQSWKQRPILIPTSALLERCLEEVAARVRDVSDTTLTSSNISTRASIIYSLNSVVRLLHEFGLCPAVAPLKAPSLKHFIQPEVQGLGDLRHPGGANPYEGHSVEELAQDFYNTSKRRLEALKQCLQSDLTVEYDLFRQGQAWIADASLPSPSEFERALNKWATPLRGQNDISQEARAANAMKRELSLTTDDDLKGALIKWLHHTYDGVFSSNNVKGKRYNLIAWAGGFNHVSRYFYGNNTAKTAVYGILLIETGFNPCAIDDLPANPIVSEDRRSGIRIATVSARKLRASGNVVNAALIEGQEYELKERRRSTDVSGIRAIAIWTELSARLRRRALDQGAQDVADAFFISVAGRGASEGAITSKLDTMGSEHWPAFLRRHAHNPVIGGLPIVRTSIRKTLSQLQALERNFSSESAKILNDHVSIVTTRTHYTGNLMMQRIHDRLFRDFQDLFEAALSSGLSQPWLSYEIEESAFEERLARAKSSGLDFLCSTKSTPSKTSDQFDDCDPLMPCDQCAVRRFTLTDGNLQLLHIGHRKLLEAAATSAPQHPQRWIQIWLPKLALLDAFVDKIRSGPYRIRFDKAAASADEKIKRGELALPIVA